MPYDYDVGWQEPDYEDYQKTGGYTVAKPKAPELKAWKDIETPDWLKQLSIQGLPYDTMRDMYMGRGVSIATQYNIGKRSLASKLALTGIRDSGFQKNLISQTESEKQSALRQLWSGIERQSTLEKEQAVERIKNLEEFNARMSDMYEQFGEEYSFDLERMGWEYQQRLNEYRSQREASQYAFWGKLAGAIPGWLVNMP